MIYTGLIDDQLRRSEGKVKRKRNKTKPPRMESTVVMLVAEACWHPWCYRHGTNLHSFNPHPKLRSGYCMVIPILQMSKQRPREVKSFAGGHSAGRWPVRLKPWQLWFLISTNLVNWKSDSNASRLPSWLTVKSLSLLAFEMHSALVGGRCSRGD